jgi:hypothetical protein
MIDPTLCALIERVQRRHILAAGFDPDKFAARTDAGEFGVGRRLILTVLAPVLRFTSRRREAEAIDAVLGYVNVVGGGMSGLNGAIAAAQTRHPEPATTLQRRDDHVFLCELRAMIVGAVGADLVDPSLRSFCDTLDRTLLATAPIGRCNAVIHANTAADNYAMVLDDELGRACVQAGFIFAALVEEGADATMSFDVSKLSERLSPQIAGSFCSMVASFVEKGSTRWAAPLAPRSEFAIGAMTTFSQLALAWMLAHEVAHAHLQHLTPVRRRALLDADDDDRRELSFAIEAEFEADAFAKRICQAICLHWGCAPGLAGASAAIALLLYDSAYDAIARAIGIDKAHGVATSRAVFRHPAPSERIARLVSGNNPIEVWARETILLLRHEASQLKVRRVHQRWSTLSDALRAERP